MAETGAEARLAQGSVLSGTYRISGLLGRGGMGSVFTADHLRLPGKRVAVKVLHSANLSDEVYHRFRREAEIATRIGHPNIVEVLDWNTLPDGTPYLVLEYLQGESLGARLARGRLSLEATFHIVRQLGSALAAAHRAGVVHRDLKPDNIFLCPTDTGGVVTDHVKVLDFGISKIQSSLTLQTQEAHVLGTPQYMAPEQASGKNKQIDQRTDVFALGAIVYEMIAGHPAFSGDNLAAVAYQVVFEDPPPLTQVVPGTPPGVSASVARALAKEPDKRYQDVQSFAAELTGRPVDTLDRPRQPSASSVDAFAPTTGTPPSTPAPVRKGRGLVWLALAVPVLAGGGLAVWKLRGTRAPAAAPAPVAAPAPAAVAAPAPAAVTAPAAAAAPATAPAAAAAPATAPASAPVVAQVRPPVKVERVKPAPTEPKPEPKPQPEPEPPVPDLADLRLAEEAMRSQNFADAVRLARHSLQERSTPHAFALMTRAYCGMKDLSNANASLQQVRGPLRVRVLRACRNMGFPLD